jgi:hypothetical protein
VNISDESFTIKAVKTVEEATELGKIGFEPFMVIEGVQDAETQINDR